MKTFYSWKKMFPKWDKEVEKVGLQVLKVRYKKF